MTPVSIELDRIQELAGRLRSALDEEPVMLEVRPRLVNRVAYRIDLAAAAISQALRAVEEENARWRSFSG
jgi:hypothetical protein